jgi:NADPH:quinone reductase-like Zn-dependent oxidoreductase
MQEAATPTPRSGEVRIRVAAAGVSAADIANRLGTYRAAPATPYVPGYEIAGTVDMVAQGVNDIREGDSVFAVSAGGGYTDHVCVSFAAVFARLPWMSALDAASLPLDYLSAYLALIQAGSLRAGQTVFVREAMSGVGLAALAICRIVGAEAFAVVGEANEPFLREQGLSHAIDPRQHRVEQYVAEATAAHGVDIVLDPSGGWRWRKSYALLAPAGRLICYEFNAATVWRASRRERWFNSLLQPTFAPTKLMRENKGVIGLNLDRLWGEYGLLQRAMGQLIHWYDEALFRPHVDRTFPLSRAAEAHAYVEKGYNRGKVLLTP